MTLESNKLNLTGFAQEALDEFPIPNVIVDNVINEGTVGPNLPFVTAYKSIQNPMARFSLAHRLITDERYSPQGQRWLYDHFTEFEDRNQSDKLAKVEALEKELRFLLIEKGIIKPTEEENSLHTFVDEIRSGSTPQAQEFNQLLTMFGSSRAIDILYRYKPEFRGVPVENVKGILADYLGDFLIAKRDFDPGDIGVGVRFLSDATFREGLTEVIKENCIINYLAQRKAGTHLGEQEAIQGYLNDLQSQIETFSDEDVKSIVSEVEKYYQSIFNDQRKPDYMIDRIKPDRNFADLGQGINIKEIEEKKRIVIADRMGLGKSASAILAKEYLGLKTALVITPAGVVGTWKDYLSDKVGENGEQVGYFKEGQTPKVLIIENKESLQGIDLSSYDYVVISQEKLNDNYTNSLLSTKFDMVIVDEVHKLKNVTDGVRANNLLKISQNNQGENQYFVMLSGTPIPDKVTDIAILLKLLYPEKYGDRDNQDLMHDILRGDVIDLRSLLLPRLQMKDMRDMIEMPELHTKFEYIDLSPAEQDIYNALLEEDELSASSKLAVLQEFLLNPDMLETTPGLPSSKIRAAGEFLTNAFHQKDKIVMFVNRHIEDVIRGDKYILDKLGLPDDIEVLVIEGNVNDEQRKAIAKRFKETKGKVLAVFSGDTVDVGVDFSDGEMVVHYNNPWTQTKKEQQTARVYRPGVKQDINEVTLLVRDTIEEGIQKYIEAKYKAIMKLLNGVPITDLEKELLERSQEDLDKLSVNSELAEYYFSTWDRMMKMFGYNRQIGEQDFIKFLEKNGEMYAEGYTELGRRSYPANTARVSGALVNAIAREKNLNPQSTKILDIASGPEMLRKHISADYQSSIVSLDINKHHFNNEGGEKVLGSFLKLPIADNSIDFANLALAIHYTKLVPTQEIFERIEAFAEASRVLKVGGTLILNNIYSWSFRDQEKFKRLSEALGFKVREEYVGKAQSELNYQSNILVLEKVEHVTPEHSEGTKYFDKLGEFILNLSNEEVNAAKPLPKAQIPTVRLRDTRRIIGQFTLNDSVYPIVFNPEDQHVLQEEQSVVSQAEELKSRYGSIEDIPREEIITNNFVRFYNGRRFVLFKKLTQDNGAVVVR